MKKRIFSILLVLAAALPAAAADTVLDAMRDEADEVVCLEAHEVFEAIGFFYRDFRQVSDEEVIEILERLGGRQEQPTKIESPTE